MSENMLQKEFKEKDVQRMRNIITKNYGNKTTTQVGYTKEQKEYKEGDVWEENNKQWTIKDGIKQTVTKLDNIKKTLLFPLTCPACSKHMIDNKLNKYMYSIHNKCFDCVIEYETKLKLEGKFDEYVLNIKKQGILYHIKEMEDILLELSLELPEESFVTEAGDIESWKGKNNNNQYIQNIKEYITKLKSTIS